MAKTIPSKISKLSREISNYSTQPLYANRQVVLQKRQPRDKKPVEEPNPLPQKSNRVKSGRMLLHMAHQVKAREPLGVRLGDI